MSADEITPPARDSSKAERILEIDEEIAALERIRPKSRTLLLAAFVILTLLLIVGFFIGQGADYTIYRYLLPTVFMVAVPAVVLAVQQAKNHKQVRDLEQELDELIADPVRPGLKPSSGH